MGQSISKIGGNTLADIKFREQVKKLDSKVDLFDSQIKETKLQLQHTVEEIKKPITLNKCDEEMLNAIQNKEGETHFDLLSIPRDESVSVNKLDKNVQETLFKSTVYDDSDVIRTGTVGASDLYLIDNQFTNCIINSVTLSCLGYGVGQVRIYENSNNIVTLVKSIDFDTRTLGTNTPKIDLNYNCKNAYIGFTRTGEGSIDFGTRNTFGLLNCSGKKDSDSFDISEATTFNNLSMKVTVETLECNYIKKEDILVFATKEDLENVVKPYVVVDKSGNGDYKTIQEALDNYNEIPIFIRNGVYEEGRLECADKSVTMIGEDKYQVKIVNYGGLYGEDCIYASKGSFSNISFISEIKEGVTPSIGQQNGAYAVHVDSNNQAEGTCVFNDCIIISDFNAGVGSGLRKNNTLEFNNCDIISRQENIGQNYANGGMGALFVHNNHTGTGDNCPNQLIRLNNCRLKSKLQYAIKIQEVSKTNADATLDINNCLVYSQANGIENVIKYSSVNNFDEMSIWRLSNTSYGNTVPELNKF